jgi:RNA recognition motif-containing protein
MARVVTDRRTGRTRGFGFASFASEKDGDALVRHQRKAAKDGDPIALNGRPVTIQRGRCLRASPRPRVAPFPPRSVSHARLARFCLARWSKRLLTAEKMPDVMRARDRRLSVRPAPSSPTFASSFGRCPRDPHGWCLTQLPCCGSRRLPQGYASRETPRLIARGTLRACSFWKFHL